jgi:hypothetical protein
MCTHLVKGVLVGALPTFNCDGVPSHRYSHFITQDYARTISLLHPRTGSISKSHKEAALVGWALSFDCLFVAYASFTQLLRFLVGGHTMDALTA